MSCSSRKLSDYSGKQSVIEHFLSLVDKIGGVKFEGITDFAEEIKDVGER